MNLHFLIVSTLSFWNILKTVKNGGLARGALLRKYTLTSVVLFKVRVEKQITSSARLWSIISILYFWVLFLRTDRNTVWLRFGFFFPLSIAMHQVVFVFQRPFIPRRFDTFELRLNMTFILTEFLFSIILHSGRNAANFYVYLSVSASLMQVICMDDNQEGGNQKLKKKTEKKRKCFQMYTVAQLGYFTRKVYSSRE